MINNANLQTALAANVSGGLPNLGSQIGSLNDARYISAAQGNAFVPFADNSLSYLDQPDTIQGYNAPEGVRIAKMSHGYKFYNPDSQRVDMSGNLYNPELMTKYGTRYTQDLFNESGALNLQGQSNLDPSNNQISGVSQSALDFAAREAANRNAFHQGAGGVNYGLSSGINAFNQLNTLGTGGLGSGGAINAANLAASNQYIDAQRSAGGGFGNFLKNFAPLALSVAALPLGAAAAGALSPALSTGVAAGQGTLSSGLGSSLLNAFNTSTALSGALTGGLGGLASGGDISSALKGAAFGGLGGGFGSSIAGGLGISSVPGQAAFRGALTGASGGLGSGNLRDAGLGALMGGGLNYFTSGGGIPGLGNAQGAALDATTGIQGMQGATQGSGILGGLTQSTGTGLTIGGQPMKLGSLLGAAGDIYGYAQGKSDIDDIQNMLAQQSAQAQAQFQPYAQAGQNALANLEGGYDAFTQDPGYQFRLEQGNQALERSLAARGLGQSGAALKAAQEYGQGLADQSYNDFFTRQSSLAGQGMNAASGLGSLYTNLGNTQAAAQLQQINDRNDLLSSLGNRVGGLGGLFDNYSGRNVFGDFFNGQKINWN